MTTTQKFSVSAAHSGKPMLTNVDRAEVESLLLAANIRQRSLVNVLEIRDSVILDAYRIIRTS